MRGEGLSTILIMAWGLSCQAHAQAVFQDGFEESATLVDSTENCPIDKSSLVNTPATNDPYDLFKPVGFNEIEKNFSQAWNVFGHQVTYPQANDTLIPVQVPAKGSYLAVRINPIAAEYVLWVFEATAVPGYSAERRGIPYITISPCRGDFRLSNHSGAAADPSLHQSCRLYGLVGTLKYGIASASSYAKCAVSYSDRPYYFNIIMADPRDGFTTTETTCQYGLSGCEFSAKHEQSNF